MAISKENEKYIKDNVKYNFIFNTLDGALYSFGMIFIAFNTIFPVFLKKLGGSNFLISLIPFITIAGASIPQLFAAHIIKGLKRKKPYVLFLGFMQRIVWGVIGISCILYGESSASTLMFISIAMYVVFSVASGFVSPAWFDLYSKVTPITLRGRSLSIRAIIGQLFGILGAIVAAAIIARVNFPYNYSILFSATFGFTMLSFASLSMVREPADEIISENRDLLKFIKSVPQVLRSNPDFKKFIFSRAFFELSMSVPAFYSVYAIKKFELTDSYAGIFTTITSVTYVLVNFLLGYIGDKKGHKLNLLIGISTLILASVIAVFSNNIYFFCTIFILISIAQSVKDISINSITVEFCSATDRATYIAISSVIMIPVSLIVLAMGTIADFFGYNYLFGLTIVSSLIALYILYFKVRDPRKIKKNKKITL